jgi:YbgC/YbaW family acyl-CoA thioester hydrolase
MKFLKTTLYPFSVQFEDIDFGGAVHNPNYLKYFERARNASLAQSGILMSELFRDGIALVLAETTIKYVRPALMDQKLFVLSRIVSASQIALRVDQGITSTQPTEDSLMQTESLSQVPGIITLCRTKMVCADLKKLRPMKFTEALSKAMELPVSSSTLGKVNVDIYPA